MTLRLDSLPRTLQLITDSTGDAPGAFLRYIDQRRLPSELVYVNATTWEEVVDAVKTLAVRGAPAIGVAGAAAVALWAVGKRDEPTLTADYLVELEDVACQIAEARPTAVNLSWGVKQALAKAQEVASQPDTTPADVAQALCSLTQQLEAEDERANRAIGHNGAALLKSGSRILTHCNAGSLATVFFGTALGVVYAAAEEGKIERVYSDETRPVGQGARLTVWELAQVGVPVTLICDDMAASVMSQGLVDAVIVGADRIAANGDVANKIGTLNVAILAHEFGIPFYVAAPVSTIDMSLASGDQIVIEQRAASEVLANPIPGVDVLNPAFDVTPARYVTAIITEQGVFAPSGLSSALSR